jgi:ribose 5-phosphate isomerase B
MGSETVPSGLRIVVGADDAGVDYKDALAQQMRADPRVSEVIDVGVQRDEHTAYPNIAIEAAGRVASDAADRALLICGTGLGMAITANKMPGVRAVTAHDVYSVERSVLSNDAQILTMGQRVIGLELARRLVDRWLELTFDRTSPSAAKVALISKYERPTDRVQQIDTGASCEPARAGAQVRTAIVGSRSGLHARPAKLFADRAKASGHDVRIALVGGQSYPAGSVLGVMSIGADKGDEVTITVTGPDAPAVADELAAMAAADLDEE